VRPDSLRTIAFVMGDRLRVGGAMADEWVEVEVRGHHVRELAAALAGFGGSIDVIEPAELRAELRQLGRELVERYGS
jgi:predicted DNA-binding transcriptional regulator YafY